jgi:hypothetical protein
MSLGNPEHIDRNLARVQLRKNAQVGQMKKRPGFNRDLATKKKPEKNNN